MKNHTKMRNKHVEERLVAVWQRLRRCPRGDDHIPLQPSWQKHSRAPCCEICSPPRLLLSKLQKRQNDFRAEEANSAGVVVSRQTSHSNAR